MFDQAAGLLPMHESWFEKSHAGHDWGFYFSPLPLTLTALAVGITVLWRVVAARLPSPEIKVFEPIGRLAPWVPRMLGVHLGVSLLALAATGAFLTPGPDRFQDALGSVLLLLEAALGVWLITGFMLRPAAAVVITLGPVLAVVSGPVKLLECANLAAVAAFLLIVPPSAERHGAVEPSQPLIRWALLAMRVGVGVALIALAFTEKFTYPDLAARTLRDYPQLNVFALVGIHLPTDTFIAVAAAIEMLFGLLIMSGALPQLAVLVVAVPFNATLALFGQTELVGHLPVYGVFLALLVYGSNPATAPLVPWLPTRNKVRALRRGLTAGVSASA